MFPKNDGSLLAACKHLNTFHLQDDIQLTFSLPAVHCA
jgi:hypothetical protein